jgi:integrase
MVQNHSSQIADVLIVGKSLSAVKNQMSELAKFFHNVCNTCGIKASPHTLRHTRATWLMQAGIDHWEAAGHLGMSLEMLGRVYGKHDPQFQKRAANV